ncbi:MAG: ABC transporter ATP-binding protein [Oligoflexia bacterium]|nr:ABC transporter ATP-binding protein [Oligoflexia bacterium]
MSDSRPTIELLDVHKRFGDLVVLDGIDLAIPPGETTAIIGPSGTGKSVLLKHIVGLLQPDSGRVCCFGTDLTTATERQLYAVRQRFGMLFQGGALFDSMSVGENVAFPLEQHSKLSPAKVRQRVEEKLDLVGLPDTWDRAVSQLSGGQRKRVGLARAIVTDPEVVLFDEPTSGLDPLTSDQIDRLILTMKAHLGVTFVVISHDIVGTVRIADHIAMLHEGKLVAWDRTPAFLRSEIPIVRAFLQRNLVLPSGPDDVATLPSFG